MLTFAPLCSLMLSPTCWRRKKDTGGGKEGGEAGRRRQSSNGLPWQLRLRWQGPPNKGCSGIMSVTQPGLCNVLCWMCCTVTLRGILITGCRISSCIYLAITHSQSCPFPPPPSSSSSSSPPSPSLVFTKLLNFLCLLCVSPPSYQLSFLSLPTDSLEPRAFPSAFRAAPRWLLWISAWLTVQTLLQQQQQERGKEKPTGWGKRSWLRLLLPHLSPSLERTTAVCTCRHVSPNI